MGRKESCPNCGSKKIAIELDGTKKCNTCKHEWTYKTGRKTEKKSKVRFR